jgi:transketolase C-terminal domain/subunit
MLNPTQKLNPKIGQADIEQVPSRNGFGEGLLHLGEHNKDVVALTGDLAESTRVLAKYDGRGCRNGVDGENSFRG